MHKSRQICESLFVTHCRKKYEKTHKLHFYSHRNCVLTDKRNEVKTFVFCDYYQSPLSKKWVYQVHTHLEKFYSQTVLNSDAFYDFSKNPARPKKKETRNFIMYNLRLLLFISDDDFFSYISGEQRGLSLAEKEHARRARHNFLVRNMEAPADCILTDFFDEYSPHIKG